MLFLLITVVDVLRCPCLLQGNEQLAPPQQPQQQQHQQLRQPPPQQQRNRLPGVGTGRVPCEAFSRTGRRVTARTAAAAAAAAAQTPPGAAAEAAAAASAPRSGMTYLKRSQEWEVRVGRVCTEELWPRGALGICRGQRLNFLPPLLPAAHAGGWRAKRICSCMQFLAPLVHDNTLVRSRYMLALLPAAGGETGRGCAVGRCSPTWRPRASLQAAGLQEERSPTAQIGSQGGWLHATWVSYARALRCLLGLAGMGVRLSEVSASVQGVVVCK